jgi:hypothetical protein
MTYKGLYIDGEETMVLTFEDMVKFQVWERSMTVVKQEASRMVAAAPDATKLSANDVATIRKWLDGVSEMVEAGTPMLPSILKARVNFAETINYVV